MTLFMAALAAAATLYLPQSYDPGVYQWCMANLHLGAGACCNFAGGVFTSGVCVDAPGSPPAPPLPPHGDNW